MSRGKAVMLSVRPESIRIERPGDVVPSDAVGVLPARIRDIVYAGNLCDVFLNVGELKVRAQVHPSRVEGFAPTDEVAAVFDARSVWPVTRDTESEDADEAAVDEPSAEPAPDVAGGLTPTAM